MMRQVVRRVLAGAVGVAALVGIAAVHPVEQTDARFSDSEYGSGVFTAATLATPVVASCTVTSVLGTFTGFTITWTSPYPRVQQRLSINNVAVDNTNVTQSGTGPYSYSATISSGLLNTLLGSLLGSTNTVRVEAIYAGTAWASLPRHGRCRSADCSGWAATTRARDRERGRPNGQSARARARKASRSRSCSRRLATASGVLLGTCRPVVRR